MSLARLLIAAQLLVSAAALPAHAHEYYLAGFKVIHPWAEPTEPAARDAQVFLRIEEISKADRLIAASTPFAKSVELRAGSAAGSAAPALLKAVEIVPGKTLDMAPGGTHLLLRDLTAPLQWGRSYMMRLEFEKAGSVQVMLSVGAH